MKPLLSDEEITYTWNSPNCWDVPVGKWQTKQDVHLDTARAVAKAQHEKTTKAIVEWLRKKSRDKQLPLVFTDEIANELEQSIGGD